jgi:hypothetical protein
LVDLETSRVNNVEAYSAKAVDCCDQDDSTMDAGVMPQIRESTPTRAQRRRAGKACLYCHARKIRCDVQHRGSPCSNCVIQSISCEIRRRKNARSVSPFLCRNVKFQADLILDLTRMPQTSASGRTASVMEAILEVRTNQGSSKTCKISPVGFMPARKSYTSTSQDSQLTGYISKRVRFGTMLPAFRI